jgi:hypothetical protein
VRVVGPTGYDRASPGGDSLLLNVLRWDNYRLTPDTGSSMLIVMALPYLFHLNTLVTTQNTISITNLNTATTRATVVTPTITSHIDISFPFMGILHGLD